MEKPSPRSKPRSKRKSTGLEGIWMTGRKVPAKPASHELLDRLAPDWPLLLYDGATIDHILSVINNPRPSRTKNHATLPCPPRHLRSSRRPGVRSKTILARSRLLLSSDPPESGPDQVKRLA
jgi:hypothetical protein